MVLLHVVIIVVVVIDVIVCVRTAITILLVDDARELVVGSGAQSLQGVQDFPGLRRLFLHVDRGYRCRCRPSRRRRRQ